MLEFRVTKYDPIHRNAAGAYLRDDWTSVSDIGRRFSRGVLTEALYRRVEDAYAEASTAFLREAGVSELAVLGLENPLDAALSFEEGDFMDLDAVDETIRRILREEFWCRFEAAEGFVHFGDDFYMYVGTSRPCPSAEVLATRLGLFVEPYPSPYHPEP